MSRAVRCSSTGRLTILVMRMNYPSRYTHFGERCNLSRLVSNVDTMNADNDGSIGATVKRFREAQGASQAQIADEIAELGVSGIYPQTIAKIEAGNRALKFSEGIALAHVLGVEPGSFFTMLPLDELRLEARGLHRQIARVRVQLDELEAARADHLVTLARLEEDLASVLGKIQDSRS